MEKHDVPEIDLKEYPNLWTKPVKNQRQTSIRKKG